MTDKRASWNEYFLEIAKLVSTRATCDRLHVGAVIVKDNTILSTGYNGSIKGGDHCDDVGHLMVDGGCVRTVHAEVNAIAQAARNGVSINGATLYATDSPCWTCLKQITNAGISKVIYIRRYRKSEHLDWVPIPVEQYNKEWMNKICESLTETS